MGQKKVKEHFSNEIKWFGIIFKIIVLGMSFSLGNVNMIENEVVRIICKMISMATVLMELLFLIDIKNSIIHQKITRVLRSRFYE